MAVELPTSKTVTERLAEAATAYVRAWKTHPESMLDEWSALFQAVESSPVETQPVASKDVVQRLEMWGIDDADSEELYALLADAARELKDLQQFHDWASPQVHDHGRDVLEIARLRGELQASEQAETNAFRNRDSSIAENERLRAALTVERETAREKVRALDKILDASPVETSGASVHGRPGTSLEAVMAALDLLTTNVRPTAWMKGHVSQIGSNGPDEYDVDCVYGDDPPEGSGWIPLYRLPKLEDRPGVEPAEKPYCRKCGGPHWIGQCALTKVGSPEKSAGCTLEGCAMKEPHGHTHLLSCQIWDLTKQPKCTCGTER